MAISRRNFLMRVGQAGGYSAAFLAMQGIGLLPEVKASAESLEAAPGTGKGVKVVVLGGGIAGLVAAYEMRALGYECTVLEARERPGGRNWTVRPRRQGCVRRMGATQTCRWEQGHYQNFGPARLPSIHHNDAGLLQEAGRGAAGRGEYEPAPPFCRTMRRTAASRLCMRQAVNDTRGHVSELLMKCMSQGRAGRRAQQRRSRTHDGLPARSMVRWTRRASMSGSDRAGYANDGRRGG